MTPLLPRDLWSRTTRVEVALHVQCLAAAIDRVQSAFGVPPTRLSDLTAEFELADHPLTIKLFDDPEIAGHLAHVSIDVDAHARTVCRQLEAAGLECDCHGHDVWLEAPDDLPWLLKCNPERAHT